MRGAERSVKNTAKNISLIVLCAMMAVLCAVNWLMGMNVAGMPADSVMRRLHDRFLGGAVGYEVRSSGVAAADPAQMALTVDGKLCGVQYNMTDIDAGLTATRELWAQAVSGDSLTPADESELLTGLRAGSYTVTAELKNGKSAADFCKEIPENTGVLHCRYAGGRTFLSGNAALFAKSEIFIK